MTLKISWKSPLMWLYASGIVLLILAVWVWAFKISMDPERVFWNTMERSLSTRGVTVQSEQSGNGATAQQTVRYSLGAQSLSHSITTLTQGKTTVTNEMLGTPNVDYTRYIAVETDQKRADGGDIDFSKLLGVWAKGQEGASQFFSQAVFGAALPVGGIGVPMGNLSPQDRTGLMRQIRGDMVYQISFGDVKKERVDGRVHYTYHASVRPEAYVALMKQFIKDVGLHGLDQINPEDYRNQKPLKMDITVDARSYHVLRITLLDTGGTQTYSSYDVPVQIEPPENAITGAELQKILSGLQ